MREIAGRPDMSAYPSEIIDGHRRFFTEETTVGVGTRSLAGRDLPLEARSGRPYLGPRQLRIAPSRPAPAARGRASGPAVGRTVPGPSRRTARAEELSRRLADELASLAVVVRQARQRS